MLENEEEALDRTMWRTRFGRSYGPFVKQIAEYEWMNEWMNEVHVHVTSSKFEIACDIESQVEHNGIGHPLLELIILLCGSAHETI